MTRLSPLAALACSLALAACASSGPRPAKPIDPAEVPAALARGQRALEAGDAVELDELEAAVERLRRARVTPGVDADTRFAVRSTLEVAASRLIERSRDDDALEALTASDLPRRLAVSAGVRAAELRAEAGDRRDAFRTIRRLDEQYPTHSERPRAGELLARVGFSLADDTGRYLLFFRYAAQAPEVLEYLALEYPTHPQADDALWRLARIYEDERRWHLAIQKHEELVLWAPESEYRAASEAAIPRLRLRRLKSPEYARDEMAVALEELDTWLATHEGHELEPRVRRDRIDCLQRLADNDLIVARFYRTVENPTGARYHARRALEEARLAGNREQIDEVEGLLAKLADEVEPVAPTPSLPSPEAVEGEQLDPLERSPIGGRESGPGGESER